ncbi:hypothetical protein ACJMK2_018803 [Sinanodonta woodiana]|uniref:FAS1 domain-containing protein n=1 Tax=Sinanodonta woodiana TaxID=1069815 RepID=A0ABD3UH93_SINWO
MQTVCICLSLLTVAFGQQHNLADLAQGLGATTFIELATEAGMLDILTMGGPFTIFCPTNEAFENLPGDVMERMKTDKQMLMDMMKYHLTSGMMMSSHFTNEMMVDSMMMMDGMPIGIRMNMYMNGMLMTANGSPIIKADQMATNGMIHMVGRVMFPMPMKSIPEEFMEPELSYLTTAIKTAGFASSLTGGPFTIFAPSNDAFMKLPPGELQMLMANKTALTEVLTYHMVDGTFWSASFHNGMSIPTFEGQNLMINTDGMKVMVNNAEVMIADIACTNGVIHMINSVLMPHMMYRSPFSI